MAMWRPGGQTRMFRFWRANGWCAVGGQGYSEIGSFSDSLLRGAGSEEAPSINIIPSPRWPLAALVLRRKPSAILLLGANIHLQAPGPNPTPGGGPDYYYYSS
ncbi:hypothetical protein CISG_10236 [Coccidioides immitis RMSCC 3703]|uniref:Uncharacterized protein n=2 Tax=Coccidioides immitis TaxID=5501 RepID=A0A0J8QN47_COCIT|nr:hypothetical protein CIRG_05053 [Coccidioides immitis RMSCC 2394]KMU73849.1 hypothetical protein CISG_10236 [Coccidioides immitis RMSCC 3703]